MTYGDFNAAYDAQARGFRDLRDFGDDPTPEEAWANRSAPVTDDAEPEPVTGPEEPYSA